MLQDIAPKQYHVEYTPVPLAEDALCFVFRGQEILERLGEDGMLALN